MRKIIVSSFVTLDGVMQAPGGPEEDSSGIFKYGGWSAPYYDEAVDKIVEKQKQQPGDLLLGRKTFEIFESFWPEHEDIWPGVNDITKYVVSTTINKSHWKNSVFLQSIEDIKKLKSSDGSDIFVSGSANLVQSLLKHDLVDEFSLLIHPLTLGQGKKLFADGAIPTAFKLTGCQPSPMGVIIANYLRDGEVRTGTFGS